MPGKLEIMRAVREGLDNLEVVKPWTDKVWTKAVKTELCKIGRDRFKDTVCASSVDNANYGEWLYDVTWLEYEKNGRSELEARKKLVDVPLVAECEWFKLGDIIDDFEKLLLARAGVHLMIFEGLSERIPKPRSKEVAEQLAGRVKEFNGSCAEDAWLLASWERNDDEEKGWSFRYFTIEMNTAVPFPPPSGG